MPFDVLGASSALLTGTVEVEDPSNGQEMPRLVQLAQGNCRLHLNFRVRQNRHETGRERDDPARFFSTRPIMTVSSEGESHYIPLTEGRGETQRARSNEMRFTPRNFRGVRF